MQRSSHHQQAKGGEKRQFEGQLHFGMAIPPPGIFEDDRMSKAMERAHNLGMDFVGAVYVWVDCARGASKTPKMCC